MKDLREFENKIAEAHTRIDDYVHRTPILTSQFINKLTGSNIYFKTENFQKIGAFKARGGVNAVLSLSSEELANGIITHSSGNHAQAVAYAASIVNAKAYIVMPENSPKVKIDAVREYGGEIHFCMNTPEAREAKVKEIQGRTNSYFIHPFNNDKVIEGQATVAKELIEDVEVPLNAIIAPVGGGGLLSGTGLSSLFFGEKIKVYGAEPEGAADAILSFKSRRIERAPFVNTIADGLLTYLGDKTLPIILETVEDILLVSDEEIIGAMKLLWERMKIVVEPSGAVSTAVLIKNKSLFSGKHVGIIISGGNVDLQKLPF